MEVGLGSSEERHSGEPQLPYTPSVLSGAQGGGLGLLGERHPCPRSISTLWVLGEDLQGCELWESGVGGRRAPRRAWRALSSAVLPGFRDCLCVTARWFPSALPRGGCRAWPRVLIPDKPALCQATLGSWGARGRGAQELSCPPPSWSKFLHFQRLGPLSFQVTADVKCSLKMQLT